MNRFFTLEKSFLVKINIFFRLSAKGLVKILKLDVWLGLLLADGALTVGRGETF